MFLSLIPGIPSGFTGRTVLPEFKELASRRVVMRRQFPTPPRPKPPDLSSSEPLESSPEQLESSPPPEPPDPPDLPLSSPRRFSSCNFLPQMDLWRRFKALHSRDNLLPCAVFYPNIGLFISGSISVVRLEAQLQLPSMRQPIPEPTMSELRQVCTCHGEAAWNATTLNCRIGWFLSPRDSLYRRMTSTLAPLSLPPLLLKHGLSSRHCAMLLGRVAAIS